jgi:glycosyltransferase involved in cell wall biosynthesis
MEPSRPTLLIVVHAWGGGAIRYARELAQHVSASADVVFAWGVDNRSFHISKRDPEVPDLSFELADGLDAPVRALRELHVTRADLLCLVGLESYIDELLDRLAVPFDVTHLGYEIVALKFPQFGSDGRYIGEEVFASKVAEALQSQRLPRYLDKAARRMAASRDAAWRAARLMPGLPILPVRFPERVDPQKVVPRLVPLAAGEPLRVLVLGRLAWHKGLATIREVAQLADGENFPIEIAALGELQVGPPDVPTSPRIRVLGSYADDELEPIVRRLNPHLAWLPFPIPETHSFALSDVMSFGLPLVATGIGAVSERVEGRPATWLVPPQEATASRFSQLFKQLGASSFSIPPVWLPTSHLPPLAEGFYEHDYLTPLLVGDGQSSCLT